MCFSTRKKRDAYHNAFVVLKSKSAEFDKSGNQSHAVDGASKRCWAIQLLLLELQFKVRDAKSASKEMRTLAGAKHAC